MDGVVWVWVVCVGGVGGVWVWVVCEGGVCGVCVCICMYVYIFKCVLIFFNNFNLSVTAHNCQLI